MVMATSRHFAHTWRGGLIATCELAGLSALGVSLAALMWGVVTPRDALGATVPAEAGDGAATIAARLSRITDPFAAEASTALASVSDATGFTLHATRATADGGGTAIIAAAGGQQGAFAVGEEVAPGVVLAMVAADHVEIDVGGQRMRVAFPGATSGAAQMIASLPADYQASAYASVVPAISGLPLQPVNRNGQSAGFEVMPQADSATLAALGLRVGDIVISINGVDAASADLSQYRSQLASGQPVDIRFERGGQVQTTRLGTQ